jgi:hypothetical protein
MATHTLVPLVSISRTSARATPRHARRPDACLPFPTHPLTPDALPHILRACPDVALPLLTASRAAHKIVAAHLYRELDVEVALAGTLGQLSGGDNALQRPCCPGPREQLKVFTALRYAAADSSPLTRQQRTVCLLRPGHSVPPPLPHTRSHCGHQRRHSRK